MSSVSIKAAAAWAGPACSAASASVAGRPFTSTTVSPGMATEHKLPSSASKRSSTKVSGCSGPVISKKFFSSPSVGCAMGTPLCTVSAGALRVKMTAATAR